MQPTLAMQFFNEKVRQLNQSNGKQVVLPAKDARNLQSDLFNLLAALADTMTVSKVAEPEEIVQINMDGGGFK